MTTAPRSMTTALSSGVSEGDSNRLTGAIAHREDPGRREWPGMPWLVDMTVT